MKFQVMLTIRVTTQIEADSQAHAESLAELISTTAIPLKVPHALTWTHDRKPDVALVGEVDEVEVVDVEPA